LGREVLRISSLTGSTSFVGKTEYPSSQYPNIQQTFGGKNVRAKSPSSCLVDILGLLLSGAFKGKSILIEMMKPNYFVNVVLILFHVYHINSFVGGWQMTDEA
jgi:hypothetical protein